MSTVHDQRTNTMPLRDGDTYELRHILNVAAAYLDSGQVDDAEDLLQEAVDAGADHPDVKSLIRRLDHARGRSTSRSARAAPTTLRCNAR